MAGHERYKSQGHQDRVFDASRNAPTSRPVAVYYRQSTFAQVGNISTQLQTVDMVEELKRRGWKPDDIILIDMDAGVSGTKRIDERPGMKSLFELINDTKIGTVACEDEDRLFRDVTQIQVNIFIEACRASNVTVITPSMVYDFANEQIGAFHARQFRFKCELAAEYINTFVKGKLLRAKRRLALEGRWFGGRLPPGYMFDTRKTLPDGNLNPQWRKYVPFEPYAEVVNEYFRLFLSHAGNLHATVRQIHLHGPYYPDPQTCQPPPGFRIVYPMRRFNNGYCPGMTALTHLLTNAVYIGHWMVNDVLTIHNNHPAIVPEEVFGQAFNYLSKVMLDGSPNPNYRPFSEHARPLAEENRGVERPLYAGLIYWEYEGHLRRLGTSWATKDGQYTYQATAPEQFDDYRWRRAASPVDDAITTLLHDRLEATFDSDTWAETIATYSASYQKERKRIESQLAALERFMQGQIASLDVLSNPQMIREVEKRYEESQIEHKRLSAELSNAAAEGERLKILSELRSTYLPAVREWDQLPREKKRVIVQAMVDRIQAAPEGKYGLRLVIYWRDRSSDELVLARRTPTARYWLASELDRLLALVDRQATQVEIAAEFPDRTWGYIRHRLWKTRGQGVVEAIEPKPMHDHETYSDYQVRIEQGRPSHAMRGEKWLSDDEALLLQLLDAGATQTEIAAALPTRRWWRIRAKITKLRGHDVVIPGVGAIQRNETILDYRQRVGEGISDESTMTLQGPSFQQGY